MPSTLTFTPANWNVPQTVTLTAIDDVAIEGGETVTVTHTAASADPSYNGIVIAGVNVDVNDNDPVTSPGVTLVASGGTKVTEGGATDTYTLALDTAPTADVTITPSFGTQVTGSPTTLTFTSANWKTPQIVTVTAIDDVIVEGAHSTTISHTASSADAKYNGIAIASATVNITDNDSSPGGVTLAESGGSTSVSEGGATDSYTIVLQSAPTANVTINMAAGTQVTVAPTTLTFTSVNWKTPQTVTVTAIDDVAVEGPHSGTITHTAASADVNYNGLPIASVTTSIADNDPAAGGAVIIAESGGTTTITEGGVNDSYTVVLASVPTANVTIAVAAGTQTTAAPSTLTFTTANWNVPQSVTLTAIDDVVVQGPHTAVVTHAASSADKSYNAIAIAGVTANITDNDSAGVLVVESGGATKIAEGGATDSYTVVLGGLPTGNVVISVNAGTQATASSATLTFTTANWNIPQTVTLTAVDDATIETNPHSTVVTHTAASSDPKYSGIAIASVTAIIDENDFPAPDAVDSSDQVGYPVLLGKRTLTGLDTMKKPNGKVDDDWYGWTMGKTGTLTMDLNNIKVVSSGPQGQYTFGDLHFRIYRVANGTLYQIASSQDTMTKVLSVPVNENDRILVWVYGLFFTQASYDFSIDLK